MYLENYKVVLLRYL